MPCDSSRFDIIIEKKIPLVLSVGALDMVNFGAKDTIPSHFQQRKIHIHNAQVITFSNQDTLLNNSMSVALRTRSRRRKALCGDSNKQMKKTLVVEEVQLVTINMATPQSSVNDKMFLAFLKTVTNHNN
ncbi:hypothetical protein ES332_A06G188400v1 [Gossypium tomentosum]|uniref:UPF0261 domain-containing protein n=1 Tax=Gossypium tomentosum TaxID=34277 RepID=A0A5D2Q960_GOSTO|nr:hypothetical protein ES332_A06G188400v1 [Gossypium tomentosum]